MKQQKVLGILAAIAGAALLFFKVKPVSATPEGNLIVYLKNPPAGANKWQLAIADYNLTETMSWGSNDTDNIDAPAHFDIPATWATPYRISLAIYHHYLVDGQLTADQLYYVQSFWPTAWGEPDPNYKDIFIPDLGTYCFNVTTESIE